MATQFVKKMIIIMESNEKAFDATIGGGGLEIRRHAMCVVLELKIYILFVE
jgi:hypothetical protein